MALSGSHLTSRLNAHFLGDFYFGAHGIFLPSSLLLFTLPLSILAPWRTCLLAGPWGSERVRELRGPSGGALSRSGLKAPTGVLQLWRYFLLLWICTVFMFIWKISRSINQRAFRRPTFLYSWVLTWGPTWFLGSNVDFKHPRFLKMENNGNLAFVGIRDEWIEFPFEAITKIEMWSVNVPGSQNKSNQNKSGLWLN